MIIIIWEKKNLVKRCWRVPRGVKFRFFFQMWFCIKKNSVSTYAALEVTSRRIQSITTHFTILKILQKIQLPTKCIIWIVQFLKILENFPLSSNCYRLESWISNNKPDAFVNFLSAMRTFSDIATAEFVFYNLFEYIDELTPKLLSIWHHLKFFAKFKTLKNVGMTPIVTKLFYIVSNCHRVSELTKLLLHCVTINNKKYRHIVSN